MAVFNPTVGTTSTEVLAENTRRRRRLVILCNNSDEDIYINMGSPAVVTAGFVLKPNGGSWVDKPDVFGWMYQGIYTAVCASGGKVLSVTELEL